MPYKTIQERREHYKKNKDKINAKRREYSKRPGVRENKNKRHSEWVNKNKEKLKPMQKIYKKNYDNRIKEKVFNHYGKACICCGESNIKFLSIDHINGNGNKHRGKIKIKINNWLVKNDFPKGFQTLCFNCNWGKHINGGICPHKQKKNSKD